jgi:hypothetical protein
MIQTLFIISFAAIMSFIFIPKMLRQREQIEKGLVDETNVEPKPLLCYDCKHCIKVIEFGRDSSKCSKTIKDVKPDGDYFVTGKSTKKDPLEKYYYCTTHRTSYPNEAFCCAEAKFFEPKGEK